MVLCQKCNAVFRYPSQLKRHLERKNTCEMNTQVYSCTYCKKPWGSSKEQKRHESRCSFKDDLVRNLEKQLDLHPDYEYKNECRFCKKEMQMNHIQRHEKSCKDKLAYKEKLERLLNENMDGKSRVTHNTTNIYNITNNTTNCGNVTNISLRAFGDENLDYITSDMLADIMHGALCHISSEKGKMRFIRSTYKLIYANKDHPENHNNLIRSLKGATARVWNGEHFEEMHRKEVEEGALTTIANVTSDNFWDQPEKFERFNDFCKRYIIGDQAVDGDEPREMAKNRSAIACASYDSKETVADTHKALIEGKEA